MHEAAHVAGAPGDSVAEFALDVIHRAAGLPRCTRRCMVAVSSGLLRGASWISLALLGWACKPGPDQGRASGREPSPQAFAVEAAPPAPTGSSSFMCPDDAVGWVKVIDATHCEAPRDLLLGGSPGCLIAEPVLRIVKGDGGETIGMADDAIRSKSVYALCGFRSGDVWLSMNGRRLTSPEAALEAHVAMREATILTFDILRGAERRTLSIQLR